MLGLNTPTTSAQSFFGYQTIGVHTWYFSISWQQDQPNLGFGYARRLRGGNQFADLQAEWHFPLAEMYRLKNHQVIAGIYAAFPNSDRRRFSSNLGLHTRITRRTVGEQNRLTVGLAASYLPSYTFSASLNDGLYGVAGLRGTYEAVLVAKSWTPDSKSTAALKALAIHHIELGGNLNAHLERTLGLSLNGFRSRHWAKEDAMLLERENTWQNQGNLYFGSTYYLKR